MRYNFRIRVGNQICNVNHVKGIGADDAANKAFQFLHDSMKVEDVEQIPENESEQITEIKNFHKLGQGSKLTISEI